jgi:ethanolamine utilization protein EutM
MLFESLGIIEIGSVSSSLKVINEFNKLNDIKIIGNQILGDGIVSVFVKGHLGAIRKSLNHGAEILDYSNEFRGSHVIPMPHKDLLSKFKLERNNL